MRSTHHRSKRPDYAPLDLEPSRTRMLTPKQNLHPTTTHADKSCLCTPHPCCYLLLTLLLPTPDGGAKPVGSDEAPIWNRRTPFG